MQFLHSSAASRQAPSGPPTSRDREPSGGYQWASDASPRAETEKEGFQTGRGFLALLSMPMYGESGPRSITSVCTARGNTTATHYITLAEAPKGDVHSRVPDMTNSSSEDKVMVKGGNYSFIPAHNLSVFLPSGEKIKE